jgi:hypothetical protein
LHERFFCPLWLPHLQVDERRTKLRCSQDVLWLWLAIDPRTKLVAVLSLGPRTQQAAPMLIHCLRQMLAPSCLPLCTSDGLNLYVDAARGPIWILVPAASSRQERATVAGGGGSDLGPGENMLPGAQAGSGHTHDASGDRGRSQSRLRGIGLLGTAQYRFSRAGESDGAECASEHSHAAPGPRPSRLLTSWLT